VGLPEPSVSGTALVTGASSGIGAEVARQLASRGHSLVLVARREERLRTLATELSSENDVQVEVIAADLGDQAERDRLESELSGRGRGVEVLVNNAGFGHQADFARSPRERMVEMVRLNVEAVVDLTSRFVAPMAARGRGSVINIASLGAFQPLPGSAVYGASKAFVLSFSEALWAEARAAGVRVTAIAPGQTETPFFAIAGEDAAFGRRRMPEQVVATALRALERNAPSAVDGLMNALLARVAPRITPRRAVISIAERLVRPRGSGRDRTVPSAV
jgi:short-subunit dehydrogenase